MSAEIVFLIIDLIFIVGIMVLINIKSQKFLNYFHDIAKSVYPEKNIPKPPRETVVQQITESVGMRAKGRVYSPSKDLDKTMKGEQVDFWN